jgi:hypothetical protein
VGRSNKFENDVDVGNGSNMVDSDALTGTEFEKRGVVTVVTRYRHRGSAECSHDLDGGQTHATGRAGDEHSFVGRDMGVQDESVKGGREGFGKTTRFSIGDRCGDCNEVFGRYDTVGGLSAPTDYGRHTITHGNRSDVETNGVHHAGTLEAGNIARPTGRCGIKAPPLQEVGGIQAGGPNFDDDIIGAGLGNFLRDNLQFVVVDLHCSHEAPS